MCDSCEELFLLKCIKRAITPKWVIGFTSKLQGRKILTFFEI
jgi:hypothetical protein